MGPLIKRVRHIPSHYTGGCDKCYVRRARQHAHPLLVCLHHTHTPTKSTGTRHSRPTHAYRRPFALTHTLFLNTTVHIFNNPAALLCVYEGCFCRWVCSHTPGLPAPHTLGCKYSNTHAYIHTYSHAGHLIRFQQASSHTRHKRCVPFFSNQRSLTAYTHVHTPAQTRRWCCQTQLLQPVVNPCLISSTRASWHLSASGSGSVTHQVHTFIHTPHTIHTRVHACNQSTTTPRPGARTAPSSQHRRTHPELHSIAHTRTTKPVDKTVTQTPAAVIIMPHRVHGGWTAGTHSSHPGTAVQACKRCVC